MNLVMNIHPLKLFRPTSNKLFVTDDNKQKILIKQYCGPDASQHCQHEKMTIQQWSKAGFNVPKLLHIDNIKLNKPYLAMTFIEAEAMGKLLKSPETDKFLLIREFYRELYRRHYLAIKQNNPDLIHHDANTGNILYNNHIFYFIDFESEVKFKDVELSASVELATITRWIVRDIGIESIEQVVSIANEQYKDLQKIMQLLIDRTLKRPFQTYHRWKDRKRKIKAPNNVTKYDVANVFKKITSSS